MIIKLIYKKILFLPNNKCFMSQIWPIQYFLLIICNNNNKRNVSLLKLCKKTK